ncbi:hypothetical protein [Streptomyces sp. SPB074]|uniref:hypothetical protein n=1 Tax=Streptomyces sp. (strain SPB074) TaxID=465543 RepID=UPI00017F28FA|nr:hypothetical protein [Streptomyces sp. SPB074]EDY43208.1 conserved hypothetical protein [Streptomyces sp. SPB074]
MEPIETTYPRLQDVQDAYRLSPEGQRTVEEAYDAFRATHAPLITSVVAQMLPHLRQDAAAGRSIVFLGRDGHSFAAATRALAPDFYAASCHEAVLSRVVVEAAVQDLEANRGDRFPDYEGFRATRRRVAAEDVPGSYRRLTAYLRDTGVPAGRPESAVTLVDSSFKGTVQELLTAIYPHTDFQGRYASFGAAPDDPHPHRKRGYLVHLAAAQTGEGKGFPFDDLHPNVGLTFASKDPINSLEDTLHGPLDTPLRIAEGPVQVLQRTDRSQLQGFNPLLVPKKWRDPLAREAAKAAALLAVHDFAQEVAPGQQSQDWYDQRQREGEQATHEIRRWAARSIDADPGLKTVLDSITHRVDHPVITRLQDYLAGRGIPERETHQLWEKVENAPSRSHRADLIDEVIHTGVLPGRRGGRPSAEAARKRSTTTTRRPPGPGPGPADDGAAMPHRRGPDEAPGRGRGR